MKKIKLLACLLAVALMFAGCTEEERAEWREFGNMVPFENEPVAVIIAEPETPTESQPTETEPAEPEPQPFTTGQQVFCVYRHEGGTGLRRFFVVSVEGDFVTVTTAIPGSGEAGELLSFPIDNCYADSDDAWAAAGREPLE